MSKTQDITQKVLALRAEGKTLGQIAKELGTTSGRVAFIEMCATVTDAERITYKGDEDLGTKIVQARDTQNLSWGMIAARTGVAEGRVKRLYEATSGTPTLGLRLPKAEQPAPAAKKAPVSKPKAKAAPATKKPARTKASG